MKYFKKWGGKYKASQPRMPKVHTKSNTATGTIHFVCRRGSTCNRHARILCRLRERTVCVCV